MVSVCICDRTCARWSSQRPSKELTTPQPSFHVTQLRGQEWLTQGPMPTLPANCHQKRHITMHSFHRSSVEGHTCVFLFTQGQGWSEVSLSLMVWLRAVGWSGEVAGPHVFWPCDDTRDHATASSRSSFDLWPHHTHKHPLARGSQMQMINPTFQAGVLPDPSSPPRRLSSLSVQEGSHPNFTQERVTQ